MANRKNYEVNEHITLKLEDDKTFIYVGGEKFKHCMQLVLQIPLQDMDEYAEINSIDEAARLYKTIHNNEIKEAHNGLERFSENQDHSITPEQEFWGHCSNIQAWAENNYDTRLIHSNLALALLQKLIEVGDSRAIVVMKEEIAKYFMGWLETGKEEIINKIMHYKFIRYLNKGEWDSLLRSYADNYYSEIHPDQAEILVKIAQIIKRPVPLKGTIGYKENKKLEVSFGAVNEREDITELGLFGGLINKPKDYTSLLNSISKLENLKVLNLDSNQVVNLPDCICNMKKIEILKLRMNKLEKLPESIGNFKYIKKLFLSKNKVRILPESIGNLMSLEELSLSYNNINHIPKSIENLLNLKVLDFGYNNLDKLGKYIGKLKILEFLSLHGNKLTTLPKEITELLKLRELYLYNNPNLDNKSKKYLETLEKKNIGIIIDY